MQMLENMAAFDISIVSNLNSIVGSKYFIAWTKLPQRKYYRGGWSRIELVPMVVNLIKQFCTSVKRMKWKHGRLNNVTET